MEFWSIFLFKFHPFGQFLVQFRSIFSQFNFKFCLNFDSILVQFRVNFGSIFWSVNHQILGKMESIFRSISTKFPVNFQSILVQIGISLNFISIAGHRNKNADESGNRRNYSSGGGGGGSSSSSSSSSTPRQSNRNSAQYGSPVSTPSGRNYSDYDAVYCSNKRRSQPEATPPHPPSTSAAGSPRTPDIPSYEEALIRRRMPSKWTTWKDSSSPTSLIQVRASPIRLNSQPESASATSPPPPLPPKSEVPPLPPKQRIHLRSNPHVIPSIPVKTRSAPLRARPVTIHMDASILSSMDGSSSPSAAGAAAAPPPILPAKEISPSRKSVRNVSVVAIENNYAPLHRSFAFSTRNLRHQIENASGDDDQLASPNNWVIHFG